MELVYEQVLKFNMHVHVVRTMYVHDYYATLIMDYQV